MGEFSGSAAGCAHARQQAKVAVVLIMPRNKQGYL